MIFFYFSFFVLPLCAIAMEKTGARGQGPCIFTACWPMGARAEWFSRRLRRLHCLRAAPRPAAAPSRTSAPMQANCRPTTRMLT